METRNLKDMMNAFMRMTDKQFPASAAKRFCEELVDHGVQAYQEWRLIASRMDLHDFRELPLMMDALRDYLNNVDGKMLAFCDLLEAIEKRVRYAYEDWECLQEVLTYSPVEEVREEVAA